MQYIKASGTDQPLIIFCRLQGSNLSLVNELGASGANAMYKFSNALNVTRFGQAHQRPRDSL